MFWFAESDAVGAGVVDAIKYLFFIKNFLKLKKLPDPAVTPICSVKRL